MRVRSSRTYCLDVVVDGRTSKFLKLMQSVQLSEELPSDIRIMVKVSGAKSVPAVAAPSEIVPMASQDPLENPESVLTRDTKEEGPHDC